MVVEVGQRPARRSGVWPVVVATLLAVLALLAVVGAGGAAVWALPALIAVGAAGVATWAVRRTRADRADHEARLTRWAAAEAIAAERMRIARDLHDIVSHGLGLITMRAAAGRLEPDPAAALVDIEAASRSATAELRRMLSVLRTADEAGPRQPVDALDSLPAIVQETAALGLRTRLVVEPVGAVSPGVQVAVCRAVREGLHNVARHAGPSDVRVRIHRDGDTVVAAVSDTGPDGPRPAAPGAGHGLLGLRERVTGLGGTLHAGPAGTGFRLVARIPDPAGR